MAVTQAPLTSGGSTADATSFASASITPGANKLILATVRSTANAVPVTPTATGNGLTWVEVLNVGFNTIGTVRSRITVFRAMGASPSAGAVTFDFGAQSQGSANWSIAEFDGIDIGGTNGSAAVVQAVSNVADASAAALVITLAAFGSANNATYGAFGSDLTGTFTPGSGFTEIHDVQINAPNATLQTEWRNDNDTSVDATPNTTADMGGIAIEIKAAGGTAYTLTAAQGSYTLSGQATNLLFKRLLAAVQGSYALSGQAANLLFGRKLVAAQGSYSLSGQAANLLLGRKLAALQGSYSLSGQVANLLFGRLLAALQGSYVLTGQSANLVYSASTYILVAALGSYALSGQNANLLAARLLVASQGSYSLTGQSAGLLFGRKLVAVQGGYILTGQAANLFFGRKIIALQGSYILSGQAAVLTFSGFVFVVTPDEERVFIVPSESRIITVPSENRIFTV